MPVGYVSRPINPQHYLHKTEPYILVGQQRNFTSILGKQRDHDCKQILHIA